MMAFKAMSTIRNIFPLFQISKKKAFKIQDLMGFKPTTKYFAASKVSKKKAYKILKEEPMEYQEEWPKTSWLLWDSNPWPL